MTRNSKPPTLESMVEEVPSTALVPVDSEDVVPAAHYSFDRPVFDKEDVRYPTLKVIQMMSPEVADKLGQPGQFYITGVGALDEVVVIPIAWGKSRRYQEGVYPNKTTLCESKDAITGIGIPGGACAKCPLIEFTKDENGKIKAPKCGLMHNYVLYSPEYGLLGSTFQSTATKAAQMINAFIQAKGYANVAVKLTTKVNKGSTLTIYEPVVRVVSVPEEDLESARMLQQAAAA